MQNIPTGEGIAWEIRAAFISRFDWWKILSVDYSQVEVRILAILSKDENLLNAFNIVEEVEYCAKIYCLAKNFGEPVVLPDEEMELMAEKFKTYGQRK